MAKVAAKTYTVKIKTGEKYNTSFCGVGAGGTQFANGQATVGERMAAWFRGRKGYEVTENAVQSVQ